MDNIETIEPLNNSALRYGCESDDDSFVVLSDCEAGSAEISAASSETFVDRPGNFGDRPRSRQRKPKETTVTAWFTVVAFLLTAVSIPICIWSWDDDGINLSSRFAHLGSLFVALSLVKVSSFCVAGFKMYRRRMTAIKRSKGGQECENRSGDVVRDAGRRMEYAVTRLWVQRGIVARRIAVGLALANALFCLRTSLQGESANINGFIPSTLGTDLNDFTIPVVHATAENNVDHTKGLESVNKNMERLENHLDDVYDAIRSLVKNRDDYLEEEINIMKDQLNSLARMSNSVDMGITKSTVHDIYKDNKVLVDNVLEVLSKTKASAKEVLGRIKSTCSDVLEVVGSYTKDMTPSESAMGASLFVTVTTLAFRVLRLV